MRSLIFILLVAAPLANAREERIIQIPEHLCSTVDIREKSTTLARILSVPRNQGPIGWCYGFAAADLLSAEVGEEVSAAHVSSIYNKRVASNFFWRIGYSIGDLFKKDDLGEVFEGGFIGRALKNTLAAGSVCRELEMPYDKKYLGQFRDIMRSLDGLSDRLERETVSKAEALSELRSLLGRDQFPGVDHETVLGDIQKKNLNKVVEEIMRVSCAENLVPLPRMKVKSANKPRLNQDSQERFESSVRKIGKFYRLLNDRLDAGKPVGISYNVKLVTEQSGGHASVIVARRWNKGQCEYRIRNSWGDSCRSYREGIECDAADGSFWVSDDILYKMTKSITFIK